MTIAVAALLVVSTTLALQLVVLRGRAARPRISAAVTMVASTPVRLARRGSLATLGEWAALGARGLRSAGRTLTLAVGCLTMIVVLDWGAGSLWHKTDAAPPRAATLDLRARRLPPTTDPRAQAEAYNGRPWVSRYFAELDQVSYEYVTFIGPRIATVRGRYINSADGVRRSYTPPGARADGLEIWFFGGSTMWGKGQRDGHTIPSEVARLAEDDGVDLRVLNFGERGYISFQEFLLFERELAERGPPDLALFYDGVNERAVLQEGGDKPQDQPTVFQAHTLGYAFESAPPLPHGLAPAPPSFADRYWDESLVHQALERIGDVAAVRAAGADDVEDLARATVDSAAIYRRSVRRILHLGRGHDVPVELFWQPGHPLTVPLLPPRVHDLSDAFDGHPREGVYIDGAHTNEPGAHLAAEAIWAHLGPVVAGLAR